MKVFINFKFLTGAEISDEEKENVWVKILELLYPAIDKFCGEDRSRANFIGMAICEAVYNSFLHGGAAELLEVKIGIFSQKKLIFLIRDNGIFYDKKEIKGAIKNRDLKKLKNFKPHEKSCGFGFETIFESKPVIKIINKTLFLIWEKPAIKV